MCFSTAYFELCIESLTRTRRLCKNKMPAKKKVGAKVGDGKGNFVSKKVKRKGLKKLKTERRKKSDALATRDTMREINGGTGGEDDDSEAEEEQQREEHRQDALDTKQEQARKKRRLEPLDFTSTVQTAFERVFWKEALPGPDDLAQLNELRKSRGILVKGEQASQCPRPITSIDDPGLPVEFGTVMKAHGYSEPSLIQQQCWPAILGGNDVLCLAETGSGKTLGYLLPIIPHFLKAQAVSGARRCGAQPLALVMVPTRELCAQVHSHCKHMPRLFGMRCQVAYGGVSKAQQVDVLSDGVDVLIATPGRLLDLAETDGVSFGRVTVMILDEADKMLSLGFREQLDKISGQIRPDRLTCLFSSTFPGVLIEASKEWTRSALFIRAGRKEVNVTSTITQVIQVTAEHKKPKKLLTFLNKIKEKDKAAGNRNKSRVLIFTNKIKTTKFVADFLGKNGFVCGALHGEKDQKQREQTLAHFKCGKLPMLVATDVAGRGLDIVKLPHVVNYDFPGNLEAYINRIGRTGRAGQQGHAFSFFTRNLAKMAPDLIKLLEEHSQDVDPYLRQLAVDIASGKEVPVDGEGEGEGEGDDDEE